MMWSVSVSARQVWLASLAALSLPGTSAWAGEMGRPASPGSYLTIEGGYTYLDGSDVIGHGVNVGASLAVAPDDRLVSPDSGWHAGASLGFATPGLFVFNRAEVYFSGGESDDSVTSVQEVPPGIQLQNLDSSAVAIIGGMSTTEIERRAYEGGVKLAYDQAAGASTSYSWVLTPFFRKADEETLTLVQGTADEASRSADIETRFYGVTVAVEPETWISPSVALVGRLGVGAYYYDANGTFSAASTVPAFDSAFSDGESGAGFRALLGAGVKVRLSEGLLLTGYAEANYLSDVGTARLPDNDFATQTRASVATDDEWELNAGARLSISLDGVK